MAEMAVLAPVYILIVVGLLYLGDLVLAKQQAVMAARVLAWQDNRQALETATSVQRQFFGGLAGRVTRVVDEQTTRDLTNAGQLRRDLKDAFCVDPECYAWAGKTAGMLNGRNGKKWLWQSRADVEFTLSPSGTRTGLFHFPETVVSAHASTLLRGDFVRNRKLADQRGRPRHRIFTDTWAWTAYMKKNRAWSKSFYPPFVGIILDFYVPLPIRVRKSE